MSLVVCGTRNLLVGSNMHACLCSQGPRLTLRWASAALLQGCFLPRHLWELAAQLHVRYEKIKLLEMYLGQAVPPRPRPQPPEPSPSFDNWAMEMLWEDARLLV